jgi:hypothetical protein
VTIDAAEILSEGDQALSDYTLRLADTTPLKIKNYIANK